MRNIVDYLQKQKKTNNTKALKSAFEKLDLKIDPSKVIIVSGTNGKGSTCATLQALLIESGHSVGFFSSPHLVKINERIKLNGEDISDADFCEAFQKVHKKVTDNNLSFFEYLTFMAVYYFFVVNNNLDFAIFEVGLGGTYDATNIIPHDISVIAKLGMDHESVLGNNLLEIAKNKLGIVSKYNKVFHSKFCDTDVSTLSQKIARKFHAELIESYSYDYFVDTSSRYPAFWVKTKWGDFRMNLQGKRAAENTSLAITVFDYLMREKGEGRGKGKEKEDIKQFLPAIGKVNWPGRMEMIKYKNREIFLSGDHNTQGIQSLLDILQFYTFKRVRFVVGICRDKNYSEMIQKLLDFRNSSLYLTETPEKTLSINDYDEFFLKSAKFASPDPQKALDAAISDSKLDNNLCKTNDLIIVTGSLYLIGMIKRSLQ